MSFTSVTPSQFYAFQRGSATTSERSVGGDGDVLLVVHQEDTILCIPPAREWTSGEIHLNAPRHAVHHVRWKPAPQHSREHGGDACYRHVWRRAAATVGRAHWEPAGARNPKAAGIHPENLRAHRSWGGAREQLFCKRSRVDRSACTTAMLMRRISTRTTVCGWPCQEERSSTATGKDPT
ncbi:conserved hypothetical protein [Trichinella spiralis]|uniref:hypothetical protein n=1 Tax=Trichinella spiralis TaxID=6334 RepID=UPI0001EFE45E|nr:conserved hypothetical protein [Trichinella spiralis]